MAEYIEREAAIKAFCTGCLDEDDCHASPHKYVCAEVETINSIPAADVRPVVHGEWLRTQAYPHRIYCSNCYVTFIRNDEFLELKETPHNYCPNCGADMREEQDGR